MDEVWSNFDLVLEAFGLTLMLFVISGLLSLVFGTVLAAMRVGPVPVLAKAGATYVTLVRNTPLLVMFIFVTIVFPNIGWGIPGISIGGLDVSNYFVRGIVALTLYTSPFVCEALRSGINSVPLGQAEAARSVGMGFGQVMRSVVLPQAVRNVLPDLLSNTLEVVKLTALGSVVAVPELLYQARQAQSLTYSPTPIVVAALIYFALLWPLVRLLSRLENRALAAR